MSYSCSQCNFTSQFETALKMHRQLHHGTISDIKWDPKKLNITNEKSNTVPRAACLGRHFSENDNKGFKLGRTSSATRLFGKLRARICRSKILFAHPEEGVDQLNDPGSPSECSSKALKSKSPACSPVLDSFKDFKHETFACHLCAFDADRITVLDRHLLTDHNIGLENLLKLVMAKTKDGLSEDIAASNIYGIRTPYYKPPDEIIEEGEFIIETVSPKIKILKHAGVNTDLKASDIVELKNRLAVDEELDKLTELSSDGDKRDLLTKMKTLNECMCKFVDSSNVLKKVLTKEFDQKTSRNERCNDSPVFELGLGDQEQEIPRRWERLSQTEPYENYCLFSQEQETPRRWERPNSEKLERSRPKYGESRSGSEKLKNTSESFYF